MNTFTYVALYSSIAVYSESGLYIIMLTTQHISCPKIHEQTETFCYCLQMIFLDFI